MRDRRLPPIPSYDQPTQRYEPPTTELPTYEEQNVDSDSVHAEEPKNHPIAYLALLLSIVALLLSIYAATKDNGPTVRQVQNGDRDCVTVSQDSGPDALYCR